MKVSRWRRLAHRIHHTATHGRLALARRARRIRDWALARRRTAWSQILRGICFGSGSGLITLIIFWLTHR
ncbi:hypothetical protein [Streptomyces sp. NPDC051098]|uniref:hypothetical protein n=1 Tax=Streptomyces sp. NPDC051098 TaxID=3155411 RepID=UPI00341E5A38